MLELARKNTLDLLAKFYKIIKKYFKMNNKSTNIIVTGANGFTGRFVLRNY